MKSGFVSILGRPNVGKSTLLNKILDYQISITSSTPQTTRDQIKGIFNDDDSQIVFIDTPGIHKPKQKLGDFLNESSYKSLKDADFILFLSPIDEPIGPGDKLIIEKIINKNSAVLITKLDKGNENQAKEKAIELKKLGFKDVLGASVEIKESINHLISFLKEKLTEGEPYYNREELTDVNMRFLVKELIRESAIEQTKEEIPHSLGVEIQEFKEHENAIEVEASIHVERDSQKGMIIGKNGQMIKRIGINTRKKIEDRLGFKNTLKLKVKVSKNWTKDEKMIRKMGY